LYPAAVISSCRSDVTDVQDEVKVNA
jgi:hypothetical protein